ncbi:prepilin-type N-terminal cleavage/methylation domain-containing protein [Chloroflexota bacterium]
MIKLIRKIIKNERGATLIEVIVALGLMGLIATTFLMAIFIATASIGIADERTTAESLAKAQMESIKQQAYQDAGGIEIEYVEIDLSENPNYSISSVNRLGITVEAVLAVPWNSVNDAATTDVGLQKISLIIKHGSKEVLMLEGYKVDEGIY